MAPPAVCKICLFLTKLQHIVAKYLDKVAPYLILPDALNYNFTLIEVISTLPYWMGPNPFQSSRCWNRTNAQPFVSTFQHHHSTLSAILYHQLRSAVIEFWSPTDISQSIAVGLPLEPGLRILNLKSICQLEKLPSNEPFLSFSIA